MGLSLNPVRAKLEGSTLVIELEDQVTRVNNSNIQVEFAAEVFDFARTFTGEVYNVGSTDLPQPVEGGDAGEALSTNGLRVLFSLLGRKPGISAKHDVFFSCGNA